MEQETEDSTERAVVSAFLTVQLDNFQGCDENGLIRSVNGRLTRCTQSVFAVREKLHVRTSRFRFGIGRWFHDSCAQRNWQGNVDTFRTIGELVRKTTARSCQHRGQHLHLILEQKGEVKRNQCCKIVLRRQWNEYDRAARS